jgi:hypothetical protein
VTVYKVIRFLDGGPVTAREALPSRWAGVLAAGVGRPPVPGQPWRVALGLPLALDDLPPPPFAAVDVQWFPDLDAALANDAWLAAADPDLHAGSCHVVAEEVVVRGRDYLDGRWATGGERYKMLSFGKRDRHLDLEQFSARWRGEAGRLGTDAIPDEVRGLAYAQNHPLPRAGHEWPFDAVAEVWFERLDDLERRRAWFAARLGAAGPSPTAGFMSPAETWSMFVREAPIVS